MFHSPLDSNIIVLGNIGLSFNAEMYNFCDNFCIANNVFLNGFRINKKTTKTDITSTKIDRISYIFLKIWSLFCLQQCYSIRFCIYSWQFIY